MKTVIIMGSNKDEAHVQRITDKLKELNIAFETHIASAHKEPQKVLEILNHYSREDQIVYLTVAGRSNALSGFVAANSRFPTLACPPFTDKIDMMVNIQSTLQMPSQVPVLTILDPENAALAIERICLLSSHFLRSNNSVNQQRKDNI